MALTIEDLQTRYAPANVFEILALENKDRQLLSEFIEAFRRGSPPEKRGVFLVGPPGVGKTQTAYALGRQFKMFVVEINSSMQRDAETLEAALSYPLSSHTVDEPPLILIDEVDGMVGRKNDAESGGVQYISALLKTTTVPIILTANDEYKVSRNMSSIVKSCNRIRYKRAMPVFIREFVKKVSVAEKLGLSDIEMMQVAQASRGDMRNVYKLLVLPEAVRIEQILRDSCSIFTFMDAVFGQTSAEDCLEIYWNSDIKDLGAAYIWICENVSTYNSSTIFLERVYGFLAEYGDIIAKCVRDRNFYLEPFIIKSMIYGLKGFVGTGDDRYRKYVTPVEFTINRRVKDIRTIRDELKFMFYGRNISDKNFDENFKVIRALFTNDRKYMLAVAIQMYRYALISQEKVGEQRELFCKMASFVATCDVQLADKYVKMFEHLQKDESHKFALEASKVNPQSVRDRRGALKKKAKEEERQEEAAKREIDMSDLVDLDIDKLVG